MKSTWFMQAILALALAPLGTALGQQDNVKRTQASSKGGAPASRPASAKPPIDIDNMPLYGPPVGKPQNRIGAGARGMAGQLANGSEVFLLAPLQTSACSTPQPTLYWYLTAPTQFDIDFVIAELPGNGLQARADALLRKTYEGEQKPGLRAVNLAVENKRLRSGVQYQVTVVLHASAANDADPFSMGFIVYVRRPAQLAASPSAREYAASGFGYDAIHTLLRQIANTPADAAGQKELHKELYGLVWDQQMFYDAPPANRQADSAAETVAVAKERDRFTNFRQTLESSGGKIIGTAGAKD